MENSSSTTNIGLPVSETPQPFQVPSEAVVFLAVVATFVGLLLIFLLFLNKSLCFKKLSEFHFDEKRQTEAHSKVRKLSNSYEDPNETSSDSDDEVLRRYQQSMAKWPLGQNVQRNVPQKSIVELGRTVVKVINDTKSTTGLLDDEEMMDEYEEAQGYNSPDLVTSSRPKNFQEIESNQNLQGLSNEHIDAMSTEDIQYCPAVQTTEPSAPPRRKASTSDKHRCITINVGSLDNDDTPAVDPDGADGTPTVHITDVTLGTFDGIHNRTGNGSVGSEEGGLAVCGRYPSDQAVSADSTTSNCDPDEHLFDIGDLQDREPILISKCGNLRVTFQYQAIIRRMSVTIHEATEIPSKERGGAHNTQIRLLLLPTKKTRHKTKIKNGDNPVFEETFVFKIPSEELGTMGLRLRLYGSERMRRERMIGECVVAFASVTRDSAVTQWLTLEPRSNLSHGDSSTDIVSLNRSDSGSSCQSMQHGGMPELMIGLSYNGMTGRLSAQVIKGSNFKNMAMSRAPDTYVKLTLMSPSGAEITRSKTSVRRGQPHPLFKETFMFQVALFQLPDVTLMVSVFYNRSIKRKDMIGWFSLGFSNSSEEELSHWTEMRESKGEEVCRWHVLLEP